MPALMRSRKAAENDIDKVVASSADAEFLENLIHAMSEAKLAGRNAELVSALDEVKISLDADIEHICTTSHGEFVKSVNKLDHSREQCSRLGKEILTLVQSYQESTDRLASQKKELVDSKNVRQNLDESADALRECLDELRVANQVVDLVGKQNHYAALRALHELQNAHMTESARYQVGEMIQKSIPATRKMIADAVMKDLQTWLYRIREVTQVLGEVAFYHTETRRARQKERATKDEYLGSFKLNSSMELVADEVDEYDVLNNDDVQVDFTPLFECIHIHDALGQMDNFRAEYAATRRTQKDLLLPSSLNFDDEEVSDLKSLLEGIAGFAIIERGTMKRTENLRALVDVDELWDSMCQAAISLMSSAVQSVQNSDTLFKITGVVSLFIQTMDSWDFRASIFDNFLTTIFERHAQILKTRCSDDFHEIVSTDDYMPMPISTPEEYDKIIEVGWYKPEKDREDMTFPTVLPFSQMYPMCCVDIRNFLNEVYAIPDDHLSRSGFVDEIIKKSLDDLLVMHICEPLVERLSSQYPGQIVQIMTNLEHFEHACEELQKSLAEYRRFGVAGGSVALTATGNFNTSRAKARDRIFELVNSKIDDLVDTAEYNWASKTQEREPGNYVTELTRYLSNIMNSVLLGLPSDMKELIYSDALRHTAAKLLALPLERSVKVISPAALNNLVLDVNYLSQYVYSLQQPKLRETVTELEQTINLLQSQNPEEFFDIEQRNQKYGRVDPQNGAVLVEKVDAGRRALKEGVLPSPNPPEVGREHQRPGERLADMMRGLGRHRDTEKNSSS